MDRCPVGKYSNFMQTEEKYRQNTCENFVKNYRILPWNCVDKSGTRGLKWESREWYIKFYNIPGD